MHVPFLLLLLLLLLLLQLMLLVLLFIMLLKLQLLVLLSCREIYIWLNSVYNDDDITHSPVCSNRWKPVYLAADHPSW